MIFFTAWVIFFTIYNRIQEVEFGSGPESDYPNVEKNIALFLQTYRNSIGDLAAPQYVRWTALMELNDPENP